MSQKSYNDTPSLFLITTPIGNMDDITIRAINTLKEVEVVFSEDTRVTGQLLKHLDIKKKLISNHEHNEQKNALKALEFLKSGKSIGLVSDRGTPVISDPGYEMAKFVIDNGYNVIAIPGVTALIPALITSSLPPMPFLFFGFLNSKKTKRRKELETLKEEKMTLIFYESPHRIKEMLKDLKEVLGDRKISISREITKKFEEIYRGTIENVMNELVEPKGEFVVVVKGNNEIVETDDVSIVESVNKYIKKGYDKKEAIKIVAENLNISKNVVYNEYHKK